MKKIKILLVALILLLGVMMVVTTSYATDVKPTKNLSYQLERPYNDDNNDTTVGNDIYKFRRLKDSRELLYAVVKIFNSDASEAERFNDIFYCLRRGKGFGSVEDTNNPTGSTTYNVYEDMKANATEIIAAYNALYSINLDTEIDIEFNDKTYQDVNLYNAILWIADNAYLPTDSENYIAADYKTELLNKVGIIPTQHELITDDDLEVVQQLAFWFFTNYDEGNNVVYPSQFLGICTAPGYEVDNDVFSTRRAKYIDMIYEYFIVNSMEASIDYTREASTEISNIKFDKSVEFAIDNSNVSNSDSEVVNPYDSFYKVGPFKLNYDDPRIADKLEIRLKDKNGKIINSYYNRYNEEFGRLEKIVIFKIINETGDVVTSIAPNVNYYIKIYSLYDGSNEDAPISFDFSGFTLEAYSTYYLSNANFLSTGSGNDQAVIEINKEKISTLDEITTELPKEFDLSLRKFITSINGQELKEEDSRVPNINTNTLINGITNRKGEKEYTATYTHPKNALKVENEDKVVYTIRIYNEGELGGTATKVTDYLPAGLELVPVSKSTINDKYGWKPLADDNKIIETDYLANTTIKAFDKTLTKETAGEGWQPADEGDSGLYYADLQVECIVKANVTGEDQFLRNIAAITEDTGDDRDSVPGDPGRDDYNPPADNSTYKEDDDDYEDLVLPGKTFDLSLRKFISKVERLNKETNELEEIDIASREPSIEINGLKEGTSKTARYVHPKNKLSLKRGDIIYYTIRVYNEGELDGYATEVKDYLPEGLELVEGENDIWDVNGRVLKTDALAGQKLLAYNKDKTTEEAGWQPEKDEEGNIVGGLYYYDLTVVCRIKDDVQDGATLVNIAEITGDKSEPTDINDRDSTPGDFPDDKKNNNYEGNGNDNGYFKGQQDDDDFERVTVEPKEVFDLALRKYIVAVNDKVLSGADSRVPNVDVTPLKQSETTADYNHKKDPVEVEVGNTVTYRFTVYNEGDIDGYVYSITDYLPEGLELDTTDLTKKDSDDENLEIWEKDVFDYSIPGNTYYSKFVFNKNTRELTITRTTYHASSVIDPETGKLMDGTTDNFIFKLKAFDGATLYSDSIDVKFEVTAQNSNKDQILTNVATMTYGSTDDGATEQEIADRDSQGEEFKVPSQEQLVSESRTAYKGNTSNKDELNDSTYHYEGQQDDDDFEKIIIKGKVFDLALRKYIVAVNDKVLSGADSRVPNIDVNPLKQSETTADYKHRKDPVEVEVGDIVTYRFTVYNEGDIDGYVYSITDYLPEGLTFEPELNTNFIERKENNDYEEEDLEDKEYEYIIEGNELQILPRTIGMSKIPETNDILFGLKAFNGSNLDSKSIDIKFKVTAKNTNNDQILTNVATMNYGSQIDFLNQVNIPDRDSKGEEFTVPSQEQLVSESETAYKGNTSNKDELNDSTYHYEGQQDDDDFEKLVVKGKAFDLSLRKFITSIKRNGEEVEFDDRTPSIDTTTLINGTFERNGQKEHTATYEHSKDPLVVKKGDIVTYTLRIYNEGERAGYATEITDYIPEGLALILNYNTNFDNGWKLQENFDYDKQLMNLVGEKGFYATEEDVKNLKLEDFEDTKSLKDVKLATGKVTITTPMLQDELIKAFDKTLTEKTAGDGWQKAEKGEGGLYYKDIEVSCLVIAENTCKDVLTNKAEISQDKDEYKQDVIDRDSKPGNVANKNEDDDDYEPVILRYFDLALRKFITGVETAGKTKNVTSRIPVPKMGEDGNIVYEHSKDPVEVANNDTVIYTIRVYNEGTLAGYAEEITDDIPKGLEYLPEHSVNKKYEWKMYDKDGKVTEKVEEAVKITTDYLSEEKEVKSKMTITDKTTGEKTTPTNTRDNLIDPFDSSKAISNEKPLNPDYRDVKVAFKVTEPNTSDRIIVNSAQISKDSDDDEDSDPGKWNEGEDDQDREYIYVKYFDLSLLKWVTQTIVSVDGKTTTTETGFKPNTGKTETTGIRDNSVAEPIAKVEIDRKKLKKTTVKFVYNIKVTNEGEIAGYATEITDYIPEGLEFLSEDNKAFGWEKDGTDKVTTRALETVLLKPGESATVKIVFRWKNDANNLGVKTNIAEISEDYNEHNSKDIDSEPDNKQKPYTKEQEDDDDFALVILSIKTGKGVSYTILIISMLTLLAGGMYLIKKYVLRY